MGSAGRWASFALVVVLGACSSTPADIREATSGPVEWTVSASTDQTSVQVGDDFELALRVTHPLDGDFVPPAGADFAPFTILESATESLSPTESLLRFRLAAYVLPQDLELPALTVRYRDADGEVVSLSTPPIAISLVTSLTPEVTDVHDIKEPVSLEVPRDWTLLWWLLAALVAALVAYLLYRKLRKEPAALPAPAFVTPLPAPDVEAEQALLRLAEKKLIEQGQLTLFYTELTDIMRRYAGRRFEVPYLERTTTEILRDLRGKKVTNAPLRSILEAADLVKFAKDSPGEEAAKDVLGRAHLLLQETRPAPRAEAAS